MSQMTGGDEVNALVIDVGSCTTKAGYAGDDAPKAVFPSHVGVIPDGKEAGAMDVDGAAPNSRKLYVGQQGANYRRDNMEVASPFSSAEDNINDWEILEALWEHALKDRLRADPSEYAMMLAEPNALPRAQRERLVEVMFETFKAPAVFLAKNAVLSAFATARQTALVVNAGYRATTVAAVHDGYVLQKSIINNPIGGKVLTDVMEKALESRAIRVRPRYTFKRTEVSPGEFKVTDVEYPHTTQSFHNYQVEQVVADVKEAVCRVMEQPFEEQLHSHVPPATYELPDGTEIAVGGDQLKVPEVLFQPQLLSSFQGYNADAIKRADGSAPLSLDAAVLESVNKCDADVRRELYQGLVLTGGVSLTDGLRERLERTLAQAGPQAGKYKVVHVSNSVERKFSTWIGGSILASLGSFQQMWMSRKEFEEHGASIIAQKAP